MFDMKKIKEIGVQIQQAYDADRYVDIDGDVWLGRGDERWYVEGKGHLEDPAYWLTNVQMMKKMINELSGDEQYRRDEAVRIEALYEYAIQRTITTSGATSIIGGWWPREEVNMALLKLTDEDLEYALVRRRKAGPVEVVND